LSRAICGDSKLNIFNAVQNFNFTSILSSLSLNSSTETDDNKQTTTTTAVLLTGIKYLNSLSQLNSTQCPAKQANSTHYTCLCDTIFKSLSSLPSGLQAIWKQIKPVVLGKILYTPNTIAYRRLIKHINRTFESIDQLSSIIVQVVDVLDKIREYEPLIYKIVPYLPQQYRNDTAIKISIGNIQTIRDVLQLAKNLIDCVEKNRFEGYKTEKEAVKTGMDLIEKELFWATLVFNHTDDDNATDLPTKFTYKIRMNSSYTQNTFFVQDRFYTFGPSNCITCSIDYLYGFIYLQDIIEKGIIEMQTGQSDTLGLTTQMTP
jgi:hypothetical protein